MKTYESEIDTLKKQNEDLGKAHDESAMGAASNFELLKRDLEASQADL